MTTARLTMPRVLRTCAADGGLTRTYEVDDARVLVGVGVVPQTTSRLMEPVRRGLLSVLDDYEVNSRFTPDHVLIDLATDLDRSVRHHAGDTDPRCRATYIAAFLEGNTVWLARTGNGTVMLLRGGHLIRLEETADFERQWLPWLGAGAQDYTEPPLYVDCPPYGLDLIPGDCLVLCSLPVQEIVSDHDLKRMVAEGTPDTAADTLAGAMRVHRGVTDVAAIVIAHEPESVAESNAGSLHGDLLSGLSDLLADLGGGDDDLPDLAPATPAARPRTTPRIRMRSNEHALPSI